MHPDATPNPLGPNQDRSAAILFLDDDPERAEIFLADNPEAVWVQTAEECIARLAEAWDEVHLDHDLGGERSSTATARTAAWRSSAGSAWSPAPTSSGPGSTSTATTPTPRA